MSNLYPIRNKLRYAEIERAVFPSRSEVPNHTPDGLVVMADGAGWDPTAHGAGLVSYNESAAMWTSLGGNLFNVEKTLTSAELLALNTTPVTLVPAVENYAWIPVEIQLFLDYLSSAYAGIDAAEDLVLRYTNGSGSIVATVETTGFLDAAGSRRRHLINTAGLVTPLSAPLVFHMTTGNITTGNSPLYTRTLLRLVKLL